jgi:putative ABC transport system substrate-binding protein
MRRFAATVLLPLVMLFFVSAAAQPAPKVARIGMLCAPKCDTVYNTAFFDELGKLGWVEGINLVVERKDPDNRLDHLPAFAAHLVQSKPDLIVAVASQAAFAAKKATSDIPIVILYVVDPVDLGFTASLAKPGGNMTGVTGLVPGDFIGKMLDVLRRALPQVKRLALIINPLNASHRRLYPETTVPAAKLGFEIDLHEESKSEGVDAALWRTLRSQRTLGLANRSPLLAHRRGGQPTSMLCGA